MKRAALITGASRGIGRFTALKLAERNDYDMIIMISRHEDSGLKELREQISELAPNKLCITAWGDVGDYDFISGIHDKVVSENGRVELIINNAAVSYVGLLIDMTGEQWAETVNTNITSIYNTCHVFVPDMISVKSGRIINISSVWGLVGASCEVAYSASKGAVNAFTKALAKELAPSGISVNAAAFGAVDTDMMGGFTSDEIEALSEDIPWGRIASPDEAAECIMKLIDMPGYMTGEILKFDGGWI